MQRTIQISAFGPLNLFGTFSNPAETFLNDRWLSMREFALLRVAAPKCNYEIPNADYEWLYAALYGEWPPERKMNEKTLQLQYPGDKTAKLSNDQMHNLGILNSPGTVPPMTTYVHLATGNAFTRWFYRSMQNWPLVSTIRPTLGAQLTGVLADPMLAWDDRLALAGVFVLTALRKRVIPASPDPRIVIPATGLTDAQMNAYDVAVGGRSPWEPFLPVLSLANSVLQLGLANTSGSAAW